MRFQFGETASSEQTYDITINSANTWEKKTWDISGISSLARDQVTLFAFKITDSTSVQTFYFDDINVNAIPNIPSLDLPTNTATNQSLLPVLKTTATDPDSPADYLRYRITICRDSLMTSGCQTFTQPSTYPETGWTGQDSQSDGSHFTAYASGTQAVYTLQTALSPSTAYYWKSYAIDQGGSNAWSDTQTTPYSFTTANTPAPASNCRIQESANDTSLNILWTDNATNENNYEIQRSVNGGAWLILQTSLAANTISFQDSTVSQSHTYQYRVAPYFTSGPTYADWCYTSTLNLGVGNFSFGGLKLEGLKLN
jgi:hypothetical protein